MELKEKGEGGALTTARFRAEKNVQKIKKDLGKSGRKL